MSRLARWRLARLRRQGRWTGPPFRPTRGHVVCKPRLYDWQKDGL